MLAAFFPFHFPWSLLLSLSILPLAGPHFLPIVTLRPGYLKFQGYNAALYVPVTKCNLEVRSLFFCRANLTSLLLLDSIGGVLSRDPDPEALDEAGGASPLGAPAVWQGGCGQDLLAWSAVRQGTEV